MTFSELQPSEIESGFVCMSTGQLQQLTREIEETKAAIAQLKLAMLTAGHDLRQRVQIVVGSLELSSCGVNSVSSSRWLGRAKEHMLRLSAELELLATQADGEHLRLQRNIESVPLADVFRQLTQDWAAEAAHKNLTLCVEEPSVWVLTDQRRLSVILENLVSNAIRNTDTGEVRVHSQLCGNHVLIAVSDTGPGLPSTLFENAGRHVRHAQPSPGMGFGLSIVARTCELLEHPIELDSNRSCGTCIRLTVPLSACEG